MNKATLLTLPCLLATLLVTASPRAEDLLLYTPKPADGDQAPASPDQGILVRSVTIKNGDTLSKLSHRYIGKAGWYPQLLLFNRIENPDLIITGDKLMVPVPSGQSATSEPKATPEKKHAKGGKRHARKTAHHKGAASTEAAGPETATPEREVARPSAVKPVPAKPATAKPAATKPAATKPAAPAAVTKGAAQPETPAAPRRASLVEQESYQQAKLAYLRGDYQKALELFTEFRSKYPGSAFSADVALYQADCLLHLSGE
jgi:hypothetical protein